jgi:hypothetical protein
MTGGHNGTRSGSEYTMNTMPPPRKRGMTATEFREYLANAGVSHSEAAKRLGVTLRTVTRWARDDEGGGVPLPMAELLRAKIKPKK